MSHYASLIGDTAVRATVQWGIGFLTGALATGKLIRRHVKATTEIADSLNTATPGGLTDVLHAIQAGPAPEEHPRDAVPPLTHGEELDAAIHCGGRRAARHPDRAEEVTLAEAARQYRDAVEHRRAVLDVMVEVDREELDAAVRAAEDVLQVAWLEANCSRR